LLAEAAEAGRDARAKAGLATDWVTAWDERVERLVVDALLERAPGTCVLGEEGGVRGTGGGGRWLVDPVDGTVNFAHGFPLFGLSIAYEEAGQVLAGVVWAPALGWEFAAAHGAGATMNGVPMRVSRVADFSRALLVTGFPADRRSSPQNNFREFVALYLAAGEVRRLGAASLDLCFVARGWLDGYWERKLKPWDMAAGALIVEEAGGRVTAPDGGRFVVDSGESVATNGLIHEQLLAELRRVSP
jgi:myo-inositol-1(or 4)-monophosphatase